MRLIGTVLLCISDLDNSKNGVFIYIDNYIIDNGFTGFIALPASHETNMLKTFDGIDKSDKQKIIKGFSISIADKFSGCYVKFKEKNNESIVKGPCDILVDPSLRHANIGILALEALEIEISKRHDYAFISKKREIPKISEFEEKISFKIKKEKK